MKSIKKHSCIFCVLFVVTIFLSGCVSNTMRELIDQNDLTYGCAIQAGDLINEETSTIISENFNLLLSENGMKWSILHPTKRFWNWTDVDHMVEFAQEHDMQVKGHPLVWHDQIPGYARNIKTREEGIALLEDEISTILERYNGKITQYDVVNEALNEDGTLRESIWLKVIGDDYIDIAFTIAHKADPTAKLIYNDYNNEFIGSAKSNACYEMVKSMVERGIPIDAVGLQMHLTGSLPYNEQALRDNVKRYHDLGLEVEFSEIDVRIPTPASKENLARQEAVWKSLMNVALTEPGVSSFIMWGYTDKQSWIPAVFPGFGDAHLYDKNFKEKPVITVLKNELKINKTTK